MTTELDPANGIVCGVVGSLSPFGIAEAPGLSPETEIVQAPAEPDDRDRSQGAAEVQFQFDSNDPLAEFECAVDGAEWSSCDTPVRSSRRLLGEHTLLVRAVTPDRRLRPDPGSYTWTVVARPVATIDSGPEDQAPAEPGIQNESRTATFDVQLRPAPSTFECRLTGETTGTAWEPCTSPKTYENLGARRVHVRGPGDQRRRPREPAPGRVRVGGRRPDPAEHDDPPGPPTRPRRPARPSSSRPTSPRRSSAGSTARAHHLQLGVTITNLGPGAHTFEVLATDLSEGENVELEPAVWTWTVDTEAPGVNLLETPPAADSATSATFGFSAGDNQLVRFAFECRLDGRRRWESCASAEEYSGLLRGDHTFEIRAVDEAGNVGGASHDWEVLDTTPPETGPHRRRPARSSSLHRLRRPHLGRQPQLRVPPRRSPVRRLRQPEDVRDAQLTPPGDHTFEVRAVDEAGNIGHAGEPHLDGRSTRPRRRRRSPGTRWRRRRTRPRRSRSPAATTCTAPAEPELRVRARRRRVRRLHVAEDVHRPAGRLAHLPGARDRRRGQHRRHAGDLHVEDPGARRHDGAGDDDHARSRRRPRPRRAPRSRSPAATTSPPRAA